MDCIWHQLPVDINRRIIACLEPNELAGSVRLVCKAAAALCSEADTNTIRVRLSINLPVHAILARWCAQPGATRCLTLQQRSLLLSKIAQTGDIQALEIMIERSGTLPTYDTMEAAAVAGSINTCIYLQQHQDLSKLEFSMEAAAVAGQLTVCQGLHAAGCPLVARTFGFAAFAGQRAVCEWLMEAGCPYGARDDHPAVWAAGNGDAGLMHQLLRRLPVDTYPHFPDGLLNAIAKGCPVAVLQQFLLASTDRDYGMMEAATSSPTPDWREKAELLASHGLARKVGVEFAVCPDAVERLQWMQQHEYRMAGDDAFILAWRLAQQGNAEGVRYVLEETAEGRRLDRGQLQSVVGSLAREGQMAAVQWMRQRYDIELGATELVEAACSRNLELVAWMLDAVGQERASNAQLPSIAARLGSMEYLRWLLERGAALQPDTFRSAAGGGCVEMMEWLAAEGCPLGRPNEELYSSAAANGDLAVLACLHRLGCPWDRGTLYRAVTNGGRFRALRWLAEHCDPVDWFEAYMGAHTFNAVSPAVVGWLANRLGWQEVFGTLLRAICSGCDWSTVRWVAQRCGPVDWRMAYTAARLSANADPGVVEWLAEMTGGPESSD